MPESASSDLDGIQVLVTRPAGQAAELARQIEQAGGKVILLPTIEIAAPADEAALERIIDRLGRFDIAIFISRNSVQQALDRIEERIGRLPASVHIAAVGAGTAQALADRGYTVAIAPETRFRSETLLETEELQQVAGKRVVIFRGNGGRTLLADTLRQRGAEVEYAECYRRLRPDTDTSAVEQHWQGGGIDIVVTTSVEGLENLDAMLSERGRALLRETPVVVIGSRMVAACRRLGLKKPPVVATEARDAALVAAVRAWRDAEKAV